MTAEPSGRQKPEFHFSKGQVVRLDEGPFPTPP
jgi:transcription antitermination factor NusG